MIKEKLEEAKKIYLKKIAYLEYEIAISASLINNFELEERIREYEKKIERLNERLKKIDDQEKSTFEQSTTSYEFISDSQSTPETLHLLSAVGVDYSNLRNLLAAQKWKEADYETYRVMLQVAGKQEGDLFWEKDIKNFPCSDLYNINNLWVHYSNGHFGFSYQKRIYQELSSMREYNREVWNNFGDLVGWRVEEKWINYENYNFSLDAPKGHLPVVRGTSVVAGMFRLWFGVVSSLASRLVNCNI